MKIFLKVLAFLAVAFIVFGLLAIVATENARHTIDEQRGE